MNIEMLRECKARELKKNDCFMRGRRIFRVTKKTSAQMEAERIILINHTNATIQPPKKLDLDADIIHVKMPEFNVVEYAVQKYYQKKFI